ncbi:endonuclease subunit [uncultured Caudovirales phage]|uniref:Endonuclease subunit n=1 Tax=uncultured Caudovirales phage TaxID=2100421 RepID=A0A6J7X2D1_9CAUD|nr:endonuclease subunit [uncultured Caudovirales phage]
MIVFKSVTWKNFLSTGNSPNKVLLNKSATTLIIGKNGEGKSTILDALCFSLFGKPFRNINKGQLVNSINGKGCTVEIEFSINSKEYRIVRGIKPNIFEIYVNDELMNQDAASRDYQKVLEQQILKLNYKTFTQVVILGSASFVPFMQLPSSQRRDVIEDILDIRIFSTMNQLLKEKINDTKDTISRIEQEINLAKSLVDSQTTLIKTMTDAKTDTIKSLLAKIDENNKEILDSQSSVGSLISDIDFLSKATADKPSIDAQIEQAKSIKSKINAKLEHCHQHHEFFEEHATCPSCSQDISEDHKNKVITDLNTKIDENNLRIEELESILGKLTLDLNNINNVQNQITQKNIELSTMNNKISLLNRMNSNLQTEIDLSKADTVNVDEEKRKLKDLAKEAIGKIEQKTALQEQRNLEEVANVLLKDTGIKTAIIREYLPVMNKLINKYLQAMDAYIHFELDEAFNEHVKSRFRDDFTYASFSEGEKMRIDLSILFTWRQIAKMKNSVNTNLLLLDEIFDSSLDTAGTDYFLNLMNQFGENTNIFVISHKGDQLFDKFRSVIKFEKRNDFSVIATP